MRVAELFTDLGAIITAAEATHPRRLWRPFPGRRVVVWSSQAPIAFGEGEWHPVRVTYVGDRPRYGYTLDQARQMRDVLADVMPEYGQRLEQLAVDHITHVIRPDQPACSDHAEGVEPWQ